MPQYIVGRQGFYLYAVQYVTNRLRYSLAEDGEARCGSRRLWGPGARSFGSSKFTSCRGGRGSVRRMARCKTGWLSMVARTESGELTSSICTLRWPLELRFFSTRLTPSVTETMRGTSGPAGITRTIPGLPEPRAVPAEFHRKQPRARFLRKPGVDLLKCVRAGRTDIVRLAARAINADIDGIQIASLRQILRPQRDRGVTPAVAEWPAPTSMHW